MQSSIALLMPPTHHPAGAALNAETHERELHAIAMREALSEVRAASDRLLDFVYLSADRFWETDTEHRFTEVWGRGGVPEEVRRHWLGRRPWEIVPPTDEEERRLVERCRRLVKDRQPLEDFEYSLTPRDGTRYWISVSAKPLYDDSGRFVGYRGCNTVITERKQQEEALRIALQQAESAIQAKRSLLAAINRDLRTPMTNIVGLTALMTDGVLSQEQRHHLEIVQQSVHAMLAVVTQLVQPAVDAVVPAGAPLTSRTGS